MREWDGTKNSQRVALVENADAGDRAREVAIALAQRLEQASVLTRRIAWSSDMLHLHGETCIMLTDLESALLKDPPKAEDLAIVHSILSQAECILWVFGPVEPETAKVTDLARRAWNKTTIQLRTLELDNLDSDTCADLVLRVLRYR